MTKEYRNFQTEHGTLVNKYNVLLGNWNNIKSKFEAVTKDIEVERNRNNHREAKLNEHLAETLRYNEDLTEIIANTSKPQEPIHAERHYKTGFLDIKNEVNEFVVKNSKLNSKESLSPADQKKILEKIAEFGDCGKHSSEFLAKRLASLYTSRQFRIPLLRHVFALFLFDQVFGRFAFSVSHEVSDNLRRIEDNICHQGKLRIPAVC